jgi:hypothetical protein
MKTVTITKTLRNFGEMLEAEKAGEVSKRAVEAARQTLKDWATESEWYDYIYELWKDALEQIGFNKPELAHRGFWSQGDGASFTCASIDLEKMVKFLATKIRPSNRIGVIKGTNPPEEDFRPYLVKKIGGKVHRPDYRRLLKTIICDVDHSPMDSITGRVKRDNYGGNYLHESTCSVEWDFLVDLPDNLTVLFESFEKDVEQLRYDLCKAFYSSLEDEYESVTEDEALAETSEGNDYLFDESGEHQR